MGDPQTPDHLGIATDPQGRTLEQLTARRDELLDRIERERLVESWCWSYLTETLSSIGDHGGRLMWVQVAYLAAVVNRGTAMFRSSGATQLGMGEVERFPSLSCGCGVEVPGVRPQRRGGRDVVVVTCEACGRDLVQYDGVGYAGPTLISSQV